jgi:hypothetical protein
MPICTSTLTSKGIPESFKPVKTPNLMGRNQGAGHLICISLYWQKSTSANGRALKHCLVLVAFGKVSLRRKGNPHSSSENAVQNWLGLSERAIFYADGY